LSFSATSCAGLLPRLTPRQARSLAVRVDRYLAQRSLLEFIRQGWRQVEPGEFVSGWHIEAIAEHLEAVSSGQVRRLIINVPPRHMKSLAVAVFWPAWQWLTAPGHRWLSASYAHTLSIRDSVKCRRLVQSPFYAALMREFHPAWKLTGDVNNKVRWENNAGGVRLAASVEGTLTGEGGDCLPADVLILTEEGPTPIGEIVSKQIPVRVWAWDGEKPVLAEIEKWQARRGEELVEIELEDGHTVRCTPRHPVWTRNRGFVPAGQLTEQDECMVAE